MSVSLQIERTDINLQAIMKGKVIISPDPIKTKERIDINGNIIDPKTKRVIVPKEPDYVPPSNPAPIPKPPQAPVVNEIPKDDGLSVLEQIEAAKQKLVELEELRKLKIAQKRKELEILENKTL